MSYHYEKLLDYWRAGKLEEADKYFDRCRKEGLFTQEQIEEYIKMSPDIIDRVEEKLEKNPNLLFELYCYIKNKRNWDNDKLCEYLKIGKEDIDDIKSLKPISKKIHNKIIGALKQIIQKL